VLSPSLDTLRLFVHVLAASVWVGGQLALAAVVGRVRNAHPQALPAAAQGFARAAWPAFAVAVLTGIWSLLEIDVANTDTSYQVTLFVKIAMVAASGVAAAVHSWGRSRLALALGGAIGLLAGLAAMFLGVLLHG
jgi:putative copper export protein